MRVKMARNFPEVRRNRTTDMFLCFDLSSLHTIFSFSHMGQNMNKQTATVDHTDIRGLVTYLTSLHRGAGLSLLTGIIDRECPYGVIH